MIFDSSLDKVLRLSALLTTKATSSSVALHGVKGAPGYDLLHSGNSAVKAASDKLYRDKIASGVSSLDAQKSLAPKPSGDRLHSQFFAGHKEIGKLGGHTATAVVHVELHDRSHAVLKHSKTDEEAYAEVKVGQVANALGINSVHTTSVGPRQTLSNFVPGDNGSDLSAKAADSAKEEARHVDLPGGKAIGLLDWLTSNPDRNAGNYRVNSAGVHPTDHGSVGFSGAPPQSPFSDKHLGITYDKSWNVASLKPDFTADELAKVHTALDELKPEFEAKPEWHESMMDRLARLERAVGSHL